MSRSFPEGEHLHPDPSPVPEPAAAELRGKDLPYLAECLTYPIRAALAIQAHNVALPDSIRAGLAAELNQAFHDHLVTLVDPMAVKRVLFWETRPRELAAWTAKLAYQSLRRLADKETFGPAFDVAERILREGGDA